MLGGFNTICDENPWPVKWCQDNESFEAAVSSLEQVPASDAAHPGVKAPQSALLRALTAIIKFG